MSIRELLKDRRVELGISQHDLARHCGFMHRSNVSRLEAGKLEWKWRDVERAAKLLQLSIVISATE